MSVKIEKEQRITLDKIERIATDIKSDDEWVNDSLTQAEYTGICDGLNRLINHLKGTENVS